MTNTRHKRAYVSFVIEMEDGATHRMMVLVGKLQTGDRDARRIATEQQREGVLPLGTIASIRRTTFGE